MFWRSPRCLRCAHSPMGFKSWRRQRGRAGEHVGGRHCRPGPWERPQEVHPEPRLLSLPGHFPFRKRRLPIAQPLPPLHPPLQSVSSPQPAARQTPGFPRFRPHAPSGQSLLQEASRAVRAPPPAPHPQAGPHSTARHVRDGQGLSRNI